MFIINTSSDLANWSFLLFWHISLQHFSARLWQEAYDSKNIQGKTHHPVQLDWDEGQLSWEVVGLVATHRVQDMQGGPGILNPLSGFAMMIKKLLPQTTSSLSHKFLQCSPIFVWFKVYLLIKHKNFNFPFFKDKKDRNLSTFI